MAKRTRSLRSMREQNDHAEAAEREEETQDAADGAPETEPKVKKTRTRKVTGDKPVKEKAAAKPRVRKPKEAPRMVARWAVCDAALKRVAMFEYKDRAGADTKLALLQEQKKGTFVLQLVKEVYESPVGVEPTIAV